MSKLTQKIASVGLAVTTIVWLSGVAMIVPIAVSAQTSTVTFTRNLTLGSRGSDVQALQQWLNSHGYTVATSGAGSSGNETTYFGALTKKAVAAWQTAISLPAYGYFGPMSRAKLPSTTATVTPTTPLTGGNVVAPATGLLVSLAADTPTSGSLITSLTSAASRVKVLAVNFTAGNAGQATVTGVTFTKVGALSDAAIAGAYLMSYAGKVVAQYNSVSGGKVYFSNLSLVIPAGQTQEYYFAIDPSTGLNAGNTVSFSVNSAADIASADLSGTAIAETGSFPLQGGTMTVTTVSNPSLATFAITSSTVGSTVYAGTQGVLISQWTMSTGNSPVNLTSINFRVIGSANKADIRNVKLYVNGVQIGQALPSVSADGTAFFDLSGSPARLSTGSSNMQIFADVMGSPSFNFQFELLNSYDIAAIDTQYGVPVAVAINGGAGSLVLINQGQLTVTMSSDTPTANVAKGQSGVTISKFKIYAAGEAVKVKFLTFQILLASGTAYTATTLPLQIRNIQIVDDQGVQVGSTISTPPANAINTCDITGGGTVSNTSITATTTYTECFGTSASPINYVVAANTTRILSLKVDIQSGADFSSIQGLLAGNTSNLQGLTSSQIANTSAVSTNALSLATNAMIAAVNTAFGNQNLPKSSSNQRIGSYVLTASTAEGVTVNNLSILLTGVGSSFANLYIKASGVQFGSTYGVISASTYTFSGTSFTVPAGGSVAVDVYADILSSASGPYNGPITTLSACNGTGAVSYSSVTCRSVSGQNVTIGSASTLVVAADSGTPGATQVIMGTTGVPLASFRLTETSNVEDVKVTDLNVFQRVATDTLSTKSAFQNVTFYDSLGANLGTAGAATVSNNCAIGTGGCTATSSTAGAGYIYRFHFVTPVIVPQGNSKVITLKADVATYASQGATDNSTSTFVIATSTDAGNTTTSTLITALGSTSNAVATVAFGSGAIASGNPMTILRSNLQVIGTSIGATVNRSKGTNDDIGSITLTANAKGPVAVSYIKITFGGSAPSSTNFLAANNIVLYDPSTGLPAVGFSASSSDPCVGNNTCFIAFTDSSGFQLSAGLSKTFNIRIANETTYTQAGASGVTQSLSAAIQAVGDVYFTDGLDSAATPGVNVPATNPIPLTIVNVAFTTGQ